MTYRRWNISVLVIVLAAITAAAAIDYKVNFYGLFGDASGIKCFVYNNERITKYLFAYNYIPRNFDGLLIGSSSSDNWNTGELTGIRMYNVSLSGANITEEDLIVDKVLQASRPKLALFLIHPYLTLTFGRKTRYMNPQEYWGGLGSLQLFLGYWRGWKIRHGYARQEFNEFGRYDFIVPPQALAPMQLQAQAETDFFVDTRAIEEYRDVLERVRSSHARIVAVIPPLRMEYWKAMRIPFEEYCSRMRALFHQDEPVIDLNDQEFEDFRTDQENYQDEVHLSNRGATKIIQIINKRLNQLGLVGLASAEITD